MVKPIEYIVHFYRYDEKITDKKKITCKNSNQAVAQLLFKSNKENIKIGKISVETANVKCNGMQKYCEACMINPASQSLKTKTIPFDIKWYCYYCIKKV